MTAVADTEPVEEHNHADGLDEHGHPPERVYWIVAGVLAVMTLLELSTFYWPAEWQPWTSYLIIIMMVIKFVLVAMFFMHLKFDPKLLGRIFFFGLGLALAVYLVMLSTFVFWTGSGVAEFDDPPRSKPIPALQEQ
jgi:cytochrome c oxidase subunit 4